MEPSLTFTIPSIHDDTVLDCRIYYLTGTNATNNHRYHARGAIIAHPYAPLGGCYDDPVVGLIVKEILKQSYGTVCTFNFRGAYGSLGRTSWTGKAERADFASVVGFMVGFLNRCDSPSIGSSTNSQDTITNQLILGGYSYGSWICDHLPIVEELYKQFLAPPEGSAAAEIKARAQHLAMQRNAEVHALQDKDMPKPHTLTIGGEEISPQRRRSGEHRFSADIRSSLDISKRFSSLRRKSHDVLRATAHSSSENPESYSTTPQIPQVDIAYLLVSPLLPPISSLTTLPFGVGALKYHKDSGVGKLSANPSLAIFGDDDTFTSARKLRQWAQEISNKPASKFRFVEVTEAGHFWRSHQAQKTLKIAIAEWLKYLDANSSEFQKVSFTASSIAAAQSIT